MKVIDLFCGCGGLSLGFQNAGYDIIASYDYWSKAGETYANNFDHPYFNLDLSKEENYSQIITKDIDMIIGGPPCQDFSSAGKRDESNGRADLTVHFSRIIALHKPKWFVMENVEQIVKSKALADAKINFKDAKYGLSQIVLNASQCGVPQNRKRFFLIGELNGIDGTLNERLNSNLSIEPMTIHNYLGDTLGIEHYYRHPRSYQRRGVFSIYEPSPTIRGVNRPIPPNYQFHSGDTCKDISQIRSLTTIERSYLQTFPKDFKFTGSKTSIEQLIGNAVPVKLAEFLARNINEHIQSNDSTESFIESNGQLSMNMKHVAIK